MTSAMGCLCCCFRSTSSEEPSALMKKDGSPVESPRRSYGAIPTDDEPPQNVSLSSPRKSPNELLYDRPPQSARVKSPDPARGSSPEPVSPRPGAKQAAAPNDSADPDDKPKRTLVEIASTAQMVSTAFPASSRAARTSTPSPSAREHSEGSAKAPETLPGRRRSPSFESDTCHSIGAETDEEEEEEESEDTRILRSLTPTSPSLVSEGSEAQLVSNTPSSGSSALDVSKDSAGKKHSKAKDFVKKASKSVKKAKKKVGKGMEKMLTHEKKKKEEGGRETSDTAVSTNETSASSGQVRRVTSDRMKSKYAREKLAAMEKKREEEAGHKAAQGIPDPRQAALERGEKLSELEDKTEHMRDQAASFAHNVSLLKARSNPSS